MLLDLITIHRNIPRDNKRRGRVKLYEMFSADSKNTIYGHLHAY
jgi:hypothetical protein